MANQATLDFLLKKFGALGLDDAVQQLVDAPTLEAFIVARDELFEGLRAQKAAGALGKTAGGLLDQLTKYTIAKAPFKDTVDEDVWDATLTKFHENALEIAGVEKKKEVRSTTTSTGETSDSTADPTAGAKVRRAGTESTKVQQGSVMAQVEARLEALGIKTPTTDFLKQQGWDLSNKMGIEQAKSWLSSSKPGKAGKGVSKPIKLDLTPPFKAKLSPLGVSSLEDLGELTAHGQLPQELVQALNAHATGDSAPLQEYLRATGTVPPEVEAAARTRKGLAQVPEQFAQLKEKLKAAESTIAETGLLAEKKKLIGIKQLLGEFEKAEAAGDPAQMKQLVDRATKNSGLKQFFGDLPTAEGAARRLSDIQAEVADQNILGFGKSAENTVEQNLARLRKATESVKSGAKGAAADLLEGPAKFGQNLPLVENLTKAAKGTKLSGDVAKSVKELQALLAEGEGGVKAWMARKGGVGGVLKSPTAMALVLPMLFEVYQRMSAGASRSRERAELDVQRESLPTVQNLLETYKAQRFAQQGVNNEAPDPRIVQALRRMGPQLTNSEVAIGPDRTIDNVLALRQQLMQE